MGFNTLFYAVYGDQVQMFEYLVKEYQFNPAVVGAVRFTSTLFAIKHDSREVLSHLIRHQNEYNLNASAKNLLCTLVRFTQKFHLLKYLIEIHQIDFNFITEDGDNTLHIASRGRCAEFIEYFVGECKYDIHAVACDNATALRLATLLPNRQPVITKLLYFGAGIGTELPDGIDYSQQILIGAKDFARPVTPQTHPTAITTVAQFEVSQTLNPSTPKHLLQLLRACFSAHQQSNEVIQLQFALLREFKKRISAATFTDAVFLGLLPDLEIVINHYKKLSSFLELSHSKIKIKDEIRPPCELPVVKLLVEISYALARLSLTTACAIQIIARCSSTLEALETSQKKQRPLELKEKMSPTIGFLRLIPVSFWQHAKTVKQDQLQPESYREPLCVLQ